MLDAGRLSLCLSVLLLPAGAAPRASECETLPKLLKMDALDQRWGGVLEDADKLLESVKDGALQLGSRALEDLD